MRYQEGNTWMGGMHCLIQRRQIDCKCDGVNTTRIDKVRKRPKTRRRDSLISHLCPVWPRLAIDRCLWRQSMRGSFLRGNRNPGEHGEYYLCNKFSYPGLQEQS